MFDNLFVVDVLKSQTTKHPTTEGGLTNMIFQKKKKIFFFSKIRRNRLEIPSRVVSATVPGFFVVFFCVNDNWWNETSALLEGTLKSGMSTWHGHATEPLTKKICAYRYVRLIIIYPGRLCFVFFFNFRYSCNEITKHTKKIDLDKDVDEKKKSFTANITEYFCYNVKSVDGIDFRRLLLLIPWSVRMNKLNSSHEEVFFFFFLNLKFNNSVVTQFIIEFQSPLDSDKR